VGTCARRPRSFVVGVLTPHRFQASPCNNSTAMESPSKKGETKKQNKRRVGWAVQMYTRPSLSVHGPRAQPLLPVSLVAVRTSGVRSVRLPWPSVEGHSTCIHHLRRNQGSPLMRAVRFENAYRSWFQRNAIRSLPMPLVKVISSVARSPDNRIWNHPPDSPVYGPQSGQKFRKNPPAY